MLTISITDCEASRDLWENGGFVDLGPDYVIGLDAVCANVPPATPSPKRARGPMPRRRFQKGRLFLRNNSHCGSYWEYTKLPCGTEKKTRRTVTLGPVSMSERMAAKWRSPGRSPAAAPPQRCASYPRALLTRCGRCTDSPSTDSQYSSSNKFSPNWSQEADFGVRRTASALLSELLERAMGIEPTSAAWEAAILPLNHARSGLPYQTDRDFGKSAWVTNSLHITQAAIACCDHFFTGSFRMRPPGRVS